MFSKFCTNQLNKLLNEQNHWICYGLHFAAIVTPSTTLVKTIFFCFSADDLMCLLNDFKKTKLFYVCWTNNGNFDHCAAACKMSSPFHLKPQDYVMQIFTYLILDHIFTSTQKIKLSLYYQRNCNFLLYYSFFCLFICVVSYFQVKHPYKINKQRA